MIYVIDLNMLCSIASLLLSKIIIKKNKIKIFMDLYEIHNFMLRIYKKEQLNLISLHIKKQII